MTPTECLRSSRVWNTDHARRGFIDCTRGRASRIRPTRGTMIPQRAALIGPNRRLDQSASPSGCVRALQPVTRKRHVLRRSRHCPLPAEAHRPPRGRSPRRELIACGSPLIDIHACRRQRRGPEATASGVADGGDGSSRGRHAIAVVVVVSRQPSGTTCRLGTGLPSQELSPAGWCSQGAGHEIR